MKYIITESQYKLLNENLPLQLRRRLSFESLKDDLDFGILEDVSPCDFEDAGEFISEICDVLKDRFIENTEDVHIKPSDRDQLYHTLVDMFGEYLFEYYDKRCQ